MKKIRINRNVLGWLMLTLPLLLFAFISQGWVGILLCFALWPWS